MAKRKSMIMKRKPRIIPYPQTIDPAHRAMFDEFKVEIVGMANRNQALMDGTPGQVKQIIDGAELVFAVYPDNDSSDGVGMLVLKGDRHLKECFASGASVSVRVSAVPCVKVEQAVAAEVPQSVPRPGGHRLPLHPATVPSGTLAAPQ